MGFFVFFFQGDPPFFLTGGTALSAFYLQHRYSEDLDLFTLDSDAFDRVPFYVADIATKLNVSVQSLQTAPHFHRYRVSRTDELVIVDFVRAVVQQISQVKNRFDGIVVDTLDDITTNKICTVVSRAEIKDYIDLYFLARAGYPVEKFIQQARQKDAGISQAMVAYLLADFKLFKAPDFMIAPISVEEVQEFFHSLGRKLAVESFPH